MIKLWVIRKGSCTVSNKRRLWWEYNSRSMYCRWCHSGGSVWLLRQPWKPTIVSQATFLCCAFQKLTGKGQTTQIKYFDIGFWNFLNVVAYFNGKKKKKKLFYTLIPKYLTWPFSHLILKRMRKQGCLEGRSLFFHGCLECHTNPPYGTIFNNVAINPWV